MNNTVIIVSTVILVILFIIFGVSTVRQFQVMNEHEYEGDDEIGGARSFLRTVSSIFMQSKYPRK